MAMAMLAGCSDRRKDAVARITSAEARELRGVADILFNDLRKKRVASEYFPLKTAVWPEPIKKLKPLRVGLYPDGLALALEGDASNEQGIHVLANGMEFQSKRSRVRYERLQDGVYWYQIGK